MSSYDLEQIPLMLRLLSACVTAAERAGHIIREVTSAGQLGVIDKVSNCTESVVTPFNIDSQCARSIKFSRELLEIIQWNLP